jgi:hypothetical protein
VHVDAKPQAWWARPGPRAVLRVALAMVATLVIVCCWVTLVDELALKRYPDPLTDQATTSAFIWVGYRLWWVGPCVAVVVGERIWRRWGVIPALLLTYAMAAWVWFLAGGLALMGTDERTYCIPMGDKWSSVPLVLAPSVLALWTVRAQHRRQRSAPAA